ncbi:biotin synthase BioB [Marinithermus hydrothermalis]|uniref:Biotin synthase n=1 Tax=Marinithermus hydrothermalis (strain DSM 14884 / JCM 11576 / T1) TaxID=869210 RepID=F2NR35_MARHT|nr:biotin synthase BioB [Marinithermus hydrothermalis]AEB12613.1 Biotin synthase [Marinithermus hydrothermalis DSM 14884]
MEIPWDRLVADALQGHPPPREVALALLRLPDAETLRLVEAAWRVRRHFFGNRVKVNVLLNAQSGLCPEDCHYCSQSRASQAAIPRYRLLSVEEMVARARAAHAAGADRFCIVTSGRGASWREVEAVAEAARRIKAELPLEVCACLGLIDEAKARALKAAGVDAYNHNLNTSAARYGEICTTHTYADRVRTVQAAQAAGLAPCSGVILGMGETDEEVVELAYALRAMGAASIPVNFLIPIEGTPLGDGRTVRHLTPWACLRYLAVFRFVNPTAELRASAGRELYLRSLQPLALMIANSLFLGDYLTEKGQAAEADWRMIEDLGFVPEGAGIPS